LSKFSLSMISDKVHIRQALENEAERVAVFSRRTFYDAFAAFNTPENMDKFMRGPFSEERLIADFKEAQNFFILALEEEELLGYVKLIENNVPDLPGQPESIEISRIYVENKLTGKGVGQLLMDASIRFALDREKKVIWLGVWEHNLRAIAFYQRLGFEKFSQHDFLLGGDIQNDWLMKKDLQVEKDR